MHFEAWGADWIGQCRLAGGAIAVSVRAARNLSVATETDAPCTVLDPRTKGSLPESAAGDGPVAICADGRVLLRGVDPGQRLLIKNVREKQCRWFVVPEQGTSITVSMIPCDWGTLDGAEAFVRQQAQRLPGHTNFDLWAVLPDGAGEISVPFETHHIDENFLQTGLRLLTWRYPRLPPGGRFVAEIRGRGRALLASTELEWRP
jgi:hypothetical protein